jgi:hypothetical protein
VDDAQLKELHIRVALPVKPVKPIAPEKTA